jgi:hypothetical protein
VLDLHLFQTAAKRIEVLRRKAPEELISDAVLWQIAHGPASLGARINDLQVALSEQTAEQSLSVRHAR